MKPVPGPRVLFSTAVVIMLILLVSPILSAPAAQSRGGAPGSAVAVDGSVLAVGNASTSFASHIYLPVTLSHGRPFTGLVQDFYLVTSVLRVAGVVNDVSSQNVSFSIKALTSEEIEVDGSGSFAVPFTDTTLYYLNLTSAVRQQTQTEVVASYARLGSEVYGKTVGHVTLVTGWTNIGPADILTTGSTVPASGVASAIGYSPSNLTILYVATGQSHPFSGPKGYPGVTGFGGLLKSVDGGKSWGAVNLGLNSTSVTSILVDPGNPERLVVETQGIANPVGGAIYESVNGGRSWQETYDLGGNDLQYVNGTLYAATYGSVLKSSDFGLTWHTVSSFFAHPDNFSLVTSFDVVDGGRTIYVGVGRIPATPTGQYISNSALQMSYAEILRSADYGKTYNGLVNFTASQFNNLVPTVSQVVQNTAKPSEVWSLVSSNFFAAENGNPSVFESVDSGRTWNTVTSVPQTPEPPQHIALDPANGNVVYVAGPAELYKSVDAGATFSKLSPPYDNRFFNVDPTNDHILFLGSDQGLYESTDQGSTWEPLNNRSASMLYGVAVDGPRIFATVQDFSPLYSGDHGKSWATINKGEIGSVEVDPYNSSNVVMWTEPHATAGGPFFFVSNDGGNSFYLPSIDFAHELTYMNNGQLIAFANNPANTFYAAGGEGIYISNDLGRSWQAAPGSPKYAFEVATSPATPNLILASNYTGLYESKDSGTTWSDTGGSVIGSSLSPVPVFDSLAIDPLDPSVVMGSQYLPSPPFGTTIHAFLFMSTDGGKHFSYAGISSTDAFQSQPEVYFYSVGGTPIALYTCDQGIFMSKDLGSTWSDLTYNINAPVVSSFYLSANGTAYVSTYGTGIWYDGDPFNLAFAVINPVITITTTTTFTSSVSSSVLSITNSVSSTTTTTSTSSNTLATSVTVPSTTSSHSTSKAGNGGIPVYPYQEIALAALVAVVAVSYLLIRNQSTRRQAHILRR